MKYKLYKNTICLVWVLSAVLCAGVSYSFYSGEAANIKFNGGDINSLMVIGFIFLAFIAALVSLGTYFQKKITLIVAIPFFVFSVLFLIDNVFAEYVWDKYVYQSLVQVLLSAFTIHIITNKSVKVERNA